MGENNKIADEFYRTLQRFHNCKPKFKGNGDLANVEFFMLIGLSMLLEQKETNEKEEGVTLREIMNISGMSVSAASKKISILETKGYVNRRPSYTDRRNIFVTLTDKGRKVCEKEKENKRRFIETLIEKMGDEDMRQLLILSNRAFDIMESMDC